MNTRLTIEFLLQKGVLQIQELKELDYADLFQLGIEDIYNEEIIWVTTEN